MESKTLKELNVKPGDVVRHVCFEDGEAGRYPFSFKIDENGDARPLDQVASSWFESTSPSKFALVSRAADTPKLWRNMTPAEKGALLLAHHEGKVIECRFPHSGWEITNPPGWNDMRSYRVKPADPVVETVTLWWSAGCQGHCRKSYADTHKITFNLIDGKPDCDSIRMEEIE